MLGIWLMMSMVAFYTNDMNNSGDTDCSFSLLSGIDKQE